MTYVNTHVRVVPIAYLNMFYTYVMKNIKFTDIYKTIAQRVQSQFCKCCGYTVGQGVGVRMYCQPRTVGVGVKTTHN